MMKNKILLLLVAGFLFGCSSKRKIAEFKKQEVVVREEVKETATDSTKVIQKDSSKAVTNIKEDWQETIKETTVYDTSGRMSYTVTETNRKGAKLTNKEETKGSDTDSTNVNNSVLKKVVDSMVTNIDERNETIPDKKRNPIWNWIGGALFVCILLFFGWKVLLKR